MRNLHVAFPDFKPYAIDRCHCDTKGPSYTATNTADSNTFLSCVIWPQYTAQLYNTDTTNCREMCLQPSLVAFSNYSDRE